MQRRRAVVAHDLRSQEVVHPREDLKDWSLKVDCDEHNILELWTLNSGCIGCQSL